MDAEQNDTTDSNVVEDTSDAQCEDAESGESTDREAKMKGIGGTVEDDGASGEVGTGNDGAGGDENSGAIIDMEGVKSIPEKIISSDEMENKRSIDDDAESDEYGPLPTLPLKRARTAYFIFADEKRKGVTHEVRLSSLKMQSLIGHCRMINGIRVLSFSRDRPYFLNSKNYSTRERASPPSRRRSANSGPPSNPPRRKFTRPRRQRKRSVSFVTCSV
jgi:hypothetical protein